MFKLTKETLEQGVKYVLIEVVQVSILLTWTNFTPFSSASIVDFKHVNVSWAIYSIFTFYGKVCTKHILGLF